MLSLRMVESIFPTGEELVDSKIAENLMRFCKPTERIAHLVAKDIATYLGRHDRDRFNYYGHSRRSCMFEWLHELSATTYQHAAMELLSAARELAERDAWESCHFASLFAHFREFRYEQTVLETAANALPKEPRYESFREKLQKLVIISAGNAALQTGEIETAEAYFAKGQGDA